MKATKLFLIIAMLAFVSASYADIDVKPKVDVRVALRKAIANPGLCQAIYQQVNESELFSVEKKGLYTAKVRYHRVVYTIYGKYEEWRDFFLMDPVLLPMPVGFNGASMHP